MLVPSPRITVGLLLRVSGFATLEDTVGEGLVSVVDGAGGKLGGAAAGLGLIPLCLARLALAFDERGVFG